jgi:hypothetical protein
MPGITVGDIGPKFGFGGVDNGFMSMDHVRIRKWQLLPAGAENAPAATPSMCFIPHSTPGLNGWLAKRPLWFLDVVVEPVSRVVPVCAAVHLDQPSCADCAAVPALAARTNMMMRYTKVTPQGDYIPPPPANSKASYATMLFVRADIVKNSGGVLSKAVTIATRYAAVRRQTAPGAGEQGAVGYGIPSN